MFPLGGFSRFVFISFFTEGFSPSLLAVSCRGRPAPKPTWCAGQDRARRAHAGDARQQPRGDQAGQERRHRGALRPQGASMLTVQVLKCIYIYIYLWKKECVFLYFCGKPVGAEFVFDYFAALYSVGGVWRKSRIALRRSAVYFCSNQLEICIKNGTEVTLWVNVPPAPHFTLKRYKSLERENAPCLRPSCINQQPKITITLLVWRQIFWLFTTPFRFSGRTKERARSLMGLAWTK